MSTVKDQSLEEWDKAMDAWDECSCAPKRLCPHALEVRKASELMDKPERVQFRISKNRDVAPSPIKLVWDAKFLLDAGDSQK
jgi:hypothetical protein